MTIASFCKDYNISTSDVLRFLEQIGLRSSRINMKLTPALAMTLRKNFTEKTMENEPKAVNSEKNNYVGAQTIEIFSKNLFPKVIEVIELPNYNALSTHFDDAQVKRLCERMGNTAVRSFARIWQIADEFDGYDLLRYQLHSIANRALRIYGGQILSYLYELPFWSRKNGKVDVLRMSPSTLQKINPHYPRITLSSIDSTNSFSISFSRVVERNYSDYVAARITNNRTKASWPISNSGLVLENFQTLIPELIIFREITKSGYSLSCGYDDGFCDICGKRLYDPVSIKYGRGPACRSNYGNP